MGFVRGRSRAATRLEAIAQEAVWETGSAPTKARCLTDRGHRAPVARCGCGLYALHPTLAQCSSSYSDAHRAAQAGHGSDQVVGIVAAWGEVELHETGFRAEYTPAPRSPPGWCCGG